MGETSIGCGTYCICLKIFVSGVKINEAGGTAHAGCPVHLSLSWSKANKRAGTFIQLFLILD
jgi:hypothetical protein